MYFLGANTNATSVPNRHNYSIMAWTAERYLHSSTPTAKPQCFSEMRLHVTFTCIKPQVLDRRSHHHGWQKHHLLHTSKQLATSMQTVFISMLLLLLHNPFNGLFSRTTWVSQYRKGTTSLDLNEARDNGIWGWQRHQLDHMQTICTSLQTDKQTSTSSLNFYRPNALPDAQPTASKHWMPFILMLSGTKSHSFIYTVFTPTSTNIFYELT